jgi:phage terminase large subunit-like protein
MDSALLSPALKAYIRSLTPQQQAALLTEVETELSYDRLGRYKPYPKQAAFHRAGKTHRERALIAANRLGKTECGCAEMAIHLTGRYPDWWEGKVFTRYCNAWSVGVTGISTRDVLQAKLLGALGHYGTGLIPRDAIIDVQPSRGTPNAVDTVLVRHTSGQDSILGFKSYEQGRAKFQGVALELVHLDEEPADEGIYSECLTRTNETGGILWLTATPLLGMTTIIKSFLQGENVERY